MYSQKNFNIYPNQLINNKYIKIYLNRIKFRKESQYYKPAENYYNYYYLLRMPE